MANEEIQLRVNAMEAEMQNIIRSLIRRCTELAVANALAQAEIERLKAQPEKKPE